MRGFLIALQQLTTTIGIMLAYWVAVSLRNIDVYYEANLIKSVW